MRFVFVVSLLQYLLTTRNGVAHFIFWCLFKIQGTKERGKTGTIMTVKIIERNKGKKARIILEKRKKCGTDSWRVQE